MSIRDALRAALHRDETLAGRRAAGTETRPEWHAETVLARELGTDWRRDYHAAHSGHASEQESPA